jgi:hypothetical protein
MKYPTASELVVLRAGLRKRKPPNLFDGMWCSEPGIGGMKATAQGADFLVEWVVFTNGVKSSSRQSLWSELCNSEALELDRLAIGYMVAAVMESQGQRAQDSIGHPTTAIKEAAPYRAEAASWRHWGTVKAGHMLV